MRNHLPATLVFVLIVAACGGSDVADPSAPPPTASDDAPADSVVVEGEPEPESSDSVPLGTDAPVETISTTADDDPDAEPATADEEITPVDELPCPAPTGDRPDLAPADPDALRFDGVSAFDSGRYAFDVLGVDVAIDVPDGLDAPYRTARVIDLYGPDGGVAFVRAAEFEIETVPFDDYQAGVRPATAPFDDWLDQSGIEVVNESSRTIGDFPARDLTIIPGPGNDIGLVPLVEGWSIFPSDDPHRLSYVELGDDEPLLIVQNGVIPGSEFDRGLDAMFESVAIGGVGPTLPTLFPETPWDLGNFFSPATVGECTVSVRAFGGAEFELVEASAISGSGDEIWIADLGDRFAGFEPPRIRIITPATAAEGGQAGPPNPGAPIDTIADALAEFEADGFVLTKRDEAGSLFGAASEVYDFVGADVDPFLWFPSGHDTSSGDGFISWAARHDGEIHMTETEQGVLIVALGGERGTDDIDILRERFDRIIETLRPR